MHIHVDDIKDIKYRCFRFQISIDQYYVLSNESHLYIVIIICLYTVVNLTRPFFSLVEQCIHIDVVLRDISPIIQWMANGLELVNIFRNNMDNFVATSCNEIRVSEPITASSASVTSSSSSGSVEEEVVNVFEDIVLYTFQQTVYYITKVSSILLLCLRH